MRRLVAVLALALLPLAPAQAQFCPGASPFVFADVLASDPFCGSITFLAQNNVTLGCLVVDANNRLYCPADSVRRDQMAAFMFRLSDALFPTTCAAGQVRKWNGLAWTCADDNIGGGGGGGTLTSVAANNGLQATPNPVTGAGTIGIAPAFRLPQTCANGQVAKSAGPGVAWACANDANSGGTLTSLAPGSGIVLTPNPITTSGTVAADTAFLQRRVTGTCPVGSSIRAIDAIGNVTCETDDTGPANAYVQGGNAFGATAVLGTADNNALDVRVNNARVVRYEPNAISPNVIGGSAANLVFAGARGATIGGGGAAQDNDPLYVDELPNAVTDHYGTVGGGYGNVAGNAVLALDDAPFATVAGGRGNLAFAYWSSVGGGRGNRAMNLATTVAGGSSNLAEGEWSTVGGGGGNSASGNSTVVGGGIDNVASAPYATIAGGLDNGASGQRSTVGGGELNIASGDYSTVGGGRNNEAAGDYSVAMGRRAKAQSQGTFVFADSNDFDFGAPNVNTFRVRATGGVRFVTGINAGGGLTWSCSVFNGDAGWSCSSDRALKENFESVDAGHVLDRVAEVPIQYWSARGGDPDVRNLGPTAQDFHAAFGLGRDDTMLSAMNAAGVALAAIQGLNAKLETKVAEQSREIAELRRMVEQLLAQR